MGDSFVEYPLWYVFRRTRLLPYWYELNKMHFSGNGVSHAPWTARRVSRPLVDACAIALSHCGRGPGRGFRSALPSIYEDGARFTSERCVRCAVRVSMLSHCWPTRLGPCRCGRWRTAADDCRTVLQGGACNLRSWDGECIAQKVTAMQIYAAEL